MNTPQKIVDRLVHFTVEAYNDRYDSPTIQKLRHDYECALGQAIQMYKEASEDIRPEVIRYNELILKNKNDLPAEEVGNSRGDPRSRQEAAGEKRSLSGCACSESSI